MKRFYKTAAAGAVDGGYSVFLDGRPLKTPAKSPLVVCSSALAETIAGEWEAQGEKIQPQSMPHMKLAATAIDRVTTQRDHVVEEIAAYGGTDLLCYRAAYPQQLVRKQTAAWDPVLDWLAGRFDVHLKTTTGIAHVQQDPNHLAIMREVVEQQSDLKLSAIHTIVSLTGSLVVTLAVVDGHLDADRAFEISELDETHTIEEWGEDAEAAERRRNNKQTLAAAVEYLNLCEQ
ncbi:ATP12 family chaperone protein [Sneathiella chinensis]|uniref:ATPase n=1 Tax=Sneathiella chinensis TaxID=349750 RepID=A0ABQ5U766_9PROT|nr:ATP12 family protein [Sneathiella chinensis]GLQ07748.1 ATPase [Sneathiella chinensis]